MQPVFVLKNASAALPAIDTAAAVAAARAAEGAASEPRRQPLSLDLWGGVVAPVRKHIIAHHDQRQLGQTRAGRTGGMG